MPENRQVYAVCYKAKPYAKKTLFFRFAIIYASQHDIKTQKAYVGSVVLFHSAVDITTESFSMMQISYQTTLNDFVYISTIELCRNFEKSVEFPLK